MWGPKQRMITGLLVSVMLLTMLVVNSPAGATSSAGSPDWRSDWSVQRGFEVIADAEGFQFPTSIAFVPNPGTAPKDPLYFVTELQGTVKVVTNDRSVFTFVEDLLQQVPGQEPAENAGLAAICLDAKHGYVFVTFVRPDSQNLLRNRILRLESQPSTFSLTPTSQTELTPLMESYRSSTEHQIGGCQVDNDLLFVGVGDGSQTEHSQRTDSLLGKILRMTLDGKPAPGNPFNTDENPARAANYVWASGLRNPFGLKILDSQLFVADNGPAVDRFLHVTEGENYLWDGSDFSIGSNADAVLFPGKGVAQIDHYPRGSVLFPSRFRDSFFLTVTGSPSQKLEGVPAILAVPFDLTQGRVTSVPAPLLRYRGANTQVMAGLGFGPDGLYFLPMIPANGEASTVLKLQYNPSAEYPYLLETESNPIVLLNTHGCFACHSLNDNGGGTVGPALDREPLVTRIQMRLSSQEYARNAIELDLLDQEPFVSFRDARQQVQQAQALEKVRLWLQYRIQEPRFDDPAAQMPNLGILQDQARIMSAYLAGSEEEIQEKEETEGFFRGIVNGVRDWFPAATRANAKKYGAALFGVGFAVGGIALATFTWLYIWIRTKRRGRKSRLGS